MAAIRQRIEKRVKEYMPIESLREIAKLLLEYGADPNAEHSEPAPGYTSLMLAAEVDEFGVFNAMLGRHGDSEQYYIHPSSGLRIDCVEIAKYYNSEDIDRILGINCW
jgi:hypothetical protein